MSNEQKIYFCYQRSIKGWIPVAFYSPPDTKSVNGQSQVYSEVHVVTDKNLIGKNGKLPNLEALRAMYPPPEK